MKGRRKIAIPLFGERVSPRCEYANQMLVVEIDGGSEISRQAVTLAGLNPMQRAVYIAEQGVTDFICTGISGFIHRMLEANGVRVIRTFSFDVEEIIDCVLKGIPIDMGPSCGAERGRQGRGKGGAGRGKGRRGGAGRGGPATGRRDGRGKGINRGRFTEE